MRQIVVFAILFLCVAGVEAAPLYCSPSGGGSGADFNNLATFPNTTGFDRNTEYVLVEGSYGNKTFSEPVSGTTVITIRKANAAQDSGVTGYASSLHDGEATFSQLNFTTAYWNFDGVTGGGPSSWTSGHGFHVQHTGTTGEGADFRASNITIQHTKFTGNNGSSDSNSDTFSWGSTANNITVRYCYTTQSGRCVIFCNQSAQNVVFEYNYFGSIQGFGDVHGETASIWGTPRDWTIRWSIITDVDSTGGFMWDNSADPTGNLWIYGNIFYDAGKGWGTHGNGLIGGWTPPPEEFHNVKVYHNTFVTVSTATPVLGDLGGASTSSGLDARNNLFYDCDDSGGGIWDTISHNHFISSDVIGSNTSTSVGDPFTNLAGLDFSLTSDTTAGDSSVDAQYRTDMFGNTGTTRGAIQFVSGGDSTPPTVSTKTIGTSGTTLTLGLDETCSIGAGGNGGVTLSASGGAVTATYSSGGGSSSLVYNLSRTIYQGETVTVSYTQPGSGIEDAAGNDLATFSNSAVTNNSTQQQSSGAAAAHAQSARVGTVRAP